jgi:hypothetical protein
MTDGLYRKTGDLSSKTDDLSCETEDPYRMTEDLSRMTGDLSRMTVDPSRKTDDLSRETEAPPRVLNVSFCSSETVVLMPMARREKTRWQIARTPKKCEKMKAGNLG